MNTEKHLAWIKIGLIFTAFLWIIVGALLVLSFPYMQFELVLVFVFSSSFWIFFLIIYAEVVRRENRLKKW